MALARSVKELDEIRDELRPLYERDGPDYRLTNPWQPDRFNLHHQAAVLLEDIDLGNELRREVDPGCALLERVGSGPAPEPEPHDAGERAREPDSGLEAIRQLYERVLAHVLETRRQPSKAADDLAFRLQGLADALEAADALASAEALFRLGAAAGRDAGLTAARLATKRVRQRAGAERGALGKKKQKKHDEMVAYFMMLNGGRLPEIARYGTIQKTAQEFHCSPSQVRRVIKKVKERAHRGT